MAPGAFRGKADAAVDVYALGLTLYELLALSPGVRREGPQPADQAGDEGGAGPAGQAEPAGAAGPGDDRAQGDRQGPGQRYASAGELAEDLQRFIDDEPIKARRVSQAERAWRWCKRNPGAAATSGIAAAGLVAGRRCDPFAFCPVEQCRPRKHAQMPP